MGKDTVAAEVVQSEIVQGVEGLQMWFQASSEVVLQRQLATFFATHRPRLTHDVKNDIPACIAKIRTWLCTTSESWLIVFEDANDSSTTMWDILRQPGIETKGRVLITSQAPLHERHSDVDFEKHKLEAITTADSLNLLLKGKLFRKKLLNEACPVLNDVVLKQKCEDLGVEYADPPPGEKAKDSFERRRGLTEMSRLELVGFLDKELGNLPLSVSMVSQLIRSDPSITSTLDVLDMFEKITMQEAWKQMRNRMNDTHLFGLAISVQITVDRMDRNDKIPLQERREAKALLHVLSWLDRTQVPLTLLTGHKMKDLADGKGPRLKGK
jgi:hypothetical protein